MGEAGWVSMLVPLNHTSGRPRSVRIGVKNTAKSTKSSDQTSDCGISYRSSSDGRKTYHRLFNVVPFSLWEIDLAAVKDAVDDLKRREIADIRGYLRACPGFIRKTLSDVRIVDVNSATLKLFRVADQSEFYASIDKLLMARFPDIFGELLAAIYQEKPFFDGEVICRTLTGEEMTIQVHFELPAASEAFDSIIVSALDVSERKRLEVQFLNAQKMEAIGTLASGIAHDFNNLLMAIEGLATLMIQDTGQDHPHYTSLQHIEKQVRNGAKLTAQLLGYARKERPQFTHVDLNQVVSETAEAFGRARKQIDLVLKLGKNLHPVEADQGQIEQVLLNLCVNAADAMPEGGRLTLETLNATHKDIDVPGEDPKPGEYVLLMVRDTGGGMDHETRARIFEPFFTTKTMGRGTGLGLVSVAGIIKKLGGVVDVETAIEHGTTFKVYLPASCRAVEKNVSRAATPTVVSRNQTVLLVDDEEVVLDVAARMLQRIGLTTLSAANGEEALRIYSENKDRVDLVVLDMVMPGMGGKTVFERLKQLDSTIKVLLASGYSLNDEAAEIMRNGCDGFIQKPYNLQELTAKIDQVLRPA